MADKKKQTPPDARAPVGRHREGEIVPRHVALQRALQGRAISDHTRDELASLAETAGLQVEGTGSDGYVTAEDYANALRSAYTATVTRRRQNLAREEGQEPPADTRTES